MSDDSYCCKNCQIEFDSLQAYHLHIRLHGNPGSKLVNSPSELEQDGGIWRSQAEPEKASDGKQHRRTIKKSTNGTRVNNKRTNSASAIGKTSPKDHQTGAVLRAMTLHFLMLDKSMPWIPLMQLAHQHHVAAQQQAQDGEKWKLDPIQVVIWEAMVKSMYQAVKDTKTDGMSPEDVQQTQKIMVEFATYLDYFQKQGPKLIGNEVMHLQLKPAFRQEKIKLEAMMLPNSPSGSLWTNIVCPLLVMEGGYVQKGIEPKGDLERKIQSWLDLSAPNQRQQD